MSIINSNPGIRRIDPKNRVGVPVDSRDNLKNPHIAIDYFIDVSGKLELNTLRVFGEGTPTFDSLEERIGEKDPFIRKVSVDKQGRILLKGHELDHLGNPENIDAFYTPSFETIYFNPKDETKFYQILKSYFPPIKSRI
ncbi:hypothetical protein C0585_02880 [Candidatus Woesearchaeota archaeon]|nr:MAG: hypothetical protein C0585_02880 [Candidatus Woesearchaeota archaeon]